MGYFFSLSALSKSGTETGLDVSELLILVCGLVLAVGAAGEYLEEHGRLPPWMEWSRKPKLVFVWMVAISLAGEFIGDAGVFVFSGHLQTIQDNQLLALGSSAGQLETRIKTVGDEATRAESTASTASTKSSEAVVVSGNAILLASGARREADTFEKRLGGAEHKADEADSHVSEALRRVIDTTAELDRIKMPRAISDRAGLVTALKSLSGTEFTFGSVFGDDESFQLLRQLDQVFTDSGWKRIRKSVLNIGVPALTITGKDDLVDLGTNTGVRVEVEAADAANIETIALDKLPPHIKLAITLNGILFAHIIPPETFTPAARVNVVSGSSKVIRIKVGKKP